MNALDTVIREITLQGEKLESALDLDTILKIALVLAQLAETALKLSQLGVLDVHSNEDSSSSPQPPPQNNDPETPPGNVE